MPRKQTGRKMRTRSSRSKRSRRSSIGFEPLEPRNLLATLTVTTFADVVDASDGLLSLREAVIESNQNGEDDQIQLEAGTYRFQILGENEDAGLTGDYDIGSDDGHTVSMVGAGRESTFVDGRKLDRLFHLHPGSVVTFQDFTVQNGGLSVPSNSAFRGGNIFSSHSDLNLNNVVVTGGQLEEFPSVGGGMYIAGGSYNFENVIISDNDAGFNGAAIFVRQADGVITRSRIVDNALEQRTNVIKITDGDLELTRSYYDNNLGGIVVDGGNVDIDHARFLRNQTIRGVVDVKTGDLTVDDSRFVLTQLGSSLMVLGEESDVVVTDSYFHQPAFSHIFFTGKTLDVDGSEFVGRSVTSTGVNYNRGGGIYNNSAQSAESIRITNSSFVRHDQAGGIVMRLEPASSFGTTSSAIVEIISTTFEDDFVHVYFGQELKLENVSVADAFLNVNTDRVIANDVSFTEAGLIIQGPESGGVVDIDNATLFQSRIEIEDGGAMEITNSTFTEASGLRGLTAQGDSLTIENTTFDNATVSIINANTTIRSSIFENSRFHGLAVNEFDGDLMIYDSIIRNSVGIGVSTYGVDFPADRIHIVRTEITGNQQAAISLDADQILIANSLISDNYTDNTNLGTILLSPGILGQPVPTLTIYNSVIANNEKDASEGGGVIRTGGNGRVAILSSTVVNNSSIGSGSIVDVNSSDSEVEVEIANSILWGNTSGDGVLIDNADFEFVVASTIQDDDPDDASIPFGGGANDNIDDMPLFVDAAAGDFRPLFNSPTVDAGAATFLRPDDLDVDDDGNLTEHGPDFDLLDRVVGLGTDMGAFEYPNFIA